jgi:SAM-dependent methyltransferase
VDDDPSGSAAVADTRRDFFGAKVACVYTIRVATESEESLRNIREWNPGSLSPRLASPAYEIHHGRQRRSDAALPVVPSWTERLFTADFLHQADLTWRHDKPVWNDHQSPSLAAAEWDRHWLRLQHGLFGRLCSLYRRQIRSRCVARYIAKYFPRHGLFAECGCGSGETSGRLGTNRTVIAVDFSEIALDQALRFPCYSGGVSADIRQLPFRDDSLDGIWNLGVMEHFDRDKHLAVFHEFHRVLQTGGRMLLWWPPKYALDHLVFRPFGNFFPDEPGRVGMREAVDLVTAAGFRALTIDFPLNDLFTELVLVAER